MELRNVVVAIGVLALVALTLAAIVLVLAYRRLRHFRISAAADFFTTVRAVPLTLVVGLDLLDLALDVFATPINWLILNRLGLQKLRNVATIKALIPIGDAVPLLTLAWIAVRLFHLGKPRDPDLIETERVGPDRYVARPVQPPEPR